MQWRAQIFCWNEGEVSGDLLGSQYLFEILQTSLTVKNSENVVKSGCFEKRLQWRAPTLFRNEGGFVFV